ncbi:MAG: DUF378 domain-containing protein [Planctomycetota bacterium]|jgi:uncharacterized membrane protein YuzA (DUF378 family)
MKATVLKSIDMVAYALLLIGALNWGLIGLFRFDLVAAIFGSMTVFSRIVYTIVGVAAVYDLMSLPSILKRWEIHVRREPVHA